MDPLTNSSVISGWLGVVTGPHGGAFALGTIFGALIGIFLWNQYVVKPRVEQHELNCDAKIAALETRLSKVEPIADKWNQFIERKALEALKEL